MPLGQRRPVRPPGRRPPPDDLAIALAGRQADAALLFTCNGRGTRLFDVADHDAGAIARSLGPVPVGGLFAAGEFGPVGGSNFVAQLCSIGGAVPGAVVRPIAVPTPCACGR